MALSVSVILPSTAYAEGQEQGQNPQASEKSKENIIDTKEKAKENLDAKKAALAKQEENLKANEVAHVKAQAELEKASLAENKNQEQIEKVKKEIEASVDKEKQEKQD